MRKALLAGLMCMMFLGPVGDYPEEMRKTPEQTQLQEKSEETGAVTVSLSFAGDCTLGWDMRFGYGNSFYQMFDKLEAAGEDAYLYFFGAVRHIFEEDDLTVVNLEGPLTNAVEFNEKQYVFRGPPSYARILAEGGIDLVNLANNHAKDYGQRGYIDTLSALDAERIRYYGENWPHMVEVKGVTFGFLGYSGWSLGIRNKIAADIVSIREKGANVVIVSFHWGDEYSYYPNETQKALGRHAVDNGADLVIGHHPHVIQGIENYGGRYIVYSTGNFCFGGNRNPSDKDTFIFRHVFAFDSETLKRLTEEEYAEVILCSVSGTSRLNDFRPTPLTGDEARRVTDKLAEYSAELNKEEIITDMVRVVE